jgi:hypothetical protein
MNTPFTVCMIGPSDDAVLDRVAKASSTTTSIRAG